MHRVASAAIIFCKRFIRYQVKIGYQCCNKKERTHLFIDQVSIFPDPAKSAALRPCSFQYRGTVYKSPAMDLSDIFFILIRYSSFSFSLITS